MASHIDWLRAFCHTLPYTTENVQWGENLLFRVAKKMYCIMNLDPGDGHGRFAFKCTPEKYAELVEVEGIIPAPYMARNHWVSVVDVNALRRTEAEGLIRESYQIVFEKLPKRMQVELQTGKSQAKKATAKKRTPTKKAVRKRES
ncbi:MAG TPA: MmcQ/YjbR family DNA-binding protein [Candidatus Angelobacter sp.]|nr:MmcQ/YjbR family DNA-binding protein [Candidatus Angelobacter sp.]